jgi:hypothetical protein
MKLIEKGNGFVAFIFRNLATKSYEENDTRHKGSGGNHQGCATKIFEKAVFKPVEKKVENVVKCDHNAKKKKKRSKRVSFEMKLIPDVFLNKAIDDIRRIKVHSSSGKSLDINEIENRHN